MTADYMVVHVPGCTATCCQGECMGSYEPALYDAGYASAPTLSLPPRRTYRDPAGMARRRGAKPERWQRA